MVKYKGLKRHSQSLLCKPAIPFGNDYQAAQNKTEQLPQHSTFHWSSLIIWMNYDCITAAVTVQP